MKFDLGPGQFLNDHMITANAIKKDQWTLIHLNILVIENKLKC